MSTTEPYIQRARTKIVATVGPACDDPQMLTELVKQGTDVFRGGQVLRRSFHAQRAGTAELVLCGVPVAA